MFEKYCPFMTSLAQFYISNSVVAEEAVHQAWLAVIHSPFVLSIAANPC
jgi:hypothetical protein